MELFHAAVSLTFMVPFFFLMAIFTPPNTGVSAPFTSPPVTLSAGDQTILNGPGGPTNSTAAALPVVFTVRTAYQGRTPPQLSLVAQGSATTVTATLQVSFDSGTTWETFGTASALNLLTSQQILVNPGLLYRVLPTTITGGTTTVYASIS